MKRFPTAFYDYNSHFIDFLLKIKRNYTFYGKNFVKISNYGRTFLITIQVIHNTFICVELYC